MLLREKHIDKLSRKLNSNPGVVILGARQVGKTTIAKRLLAGVEEDLEYYDLESNNTLRAISIDPESFLSERADKLMVIDEVQVMPELFSILRAVIDEDRRPGRFLLLGSANPALVRGVSESLTGRVSYYELDPLSLEEVGYSEQNKHWYRGGFPLAFLAQDDEIFLEWISDYIRSYIERDINLLFNINLNTSLVRRLWTMLAHLNGSMLNSADLGRSLGVSATTVNNYIEVLEAAFLIFKLQPWYVNLGKRLVKSPKVYIKDSGILHGLLGIKSSDKLLLHPIIGSSWELYVINQIRHAVKKEFESFYYRTHNGSEIDLLLVKNNIPIASIEIKNSNNPNISRGFYTSIEDLKTTHNYIITRDNTVGMLKGVHIISLADFLKDQVPRLLNSEL